MMERLCADDSGVNHSFSYSGSRLRPDVLKLLTARTGEIIPAMSLSVGSLVSLRSSPALPQGTFPAGKSAGLNLPPSEKVRITR